MNPKTTAPRRENQPAGHQSHCDELDTKDTRRIEHAFEMEASRSLVRVTGAREHGALRVLASLATVQAVLLLGRLAERADGYAAVLRAAQGWGEHQ